MPNVTTSSTIYNLLTSQTAEQARTSIGITDHPDLTDVQAASGNWESTYSTVQAESGGWAGGSSGTALSGYTSDATETEIFIDGVPNSRMTIATDKTWMFSALVVGRTTSATDASAGYKIEGVVKNDGGSTSLGGTVVKTVFAEDDTSWNATVSADDVNDALIFLVTGAALSAVEWRATVNKTETP